MIKYLSCPDIHFSPDWIETSRVIMRAIIKNAREQAVDFVLFPGDLFDKAIYATDKGGINELTDFITELRTVCPIAAIYGTPSHDYAGCYGALQRAGLQILQPGKLYGLTANRIEEKIYSNTTCILFGIPEVTKDWYQSTHADVSADSVNAACVNLVHKLITDEIAPARSAYPDIPAVCMLHGNVSDAQDKGAEKDIILKSSDVVLRTHVMAEAGITRWEFGHIHTPWESSVVDGGYSGYAGIDRNPWGKTDFVPAMTMVEIDGTTVAKKTRLPYGTPMRVKISEPLTSYSPDIAYWLDTKNADDVDPAKLGAHPWSRITYSEDTETVRRVDVSGLENVKSLSELAKLYDTQITESQLAKFAEAERQTPKPPAIQRDVRVTDITVTGCTMMHGKTAHLDIDHLPDGLNQLVGHNGSGKSSLLGFCTPYPCFVGKDTDSGRQSAIKDFFDQPESGIQKTVICNGEIHQHTITIRGAHTKTPKTECYLSVNGAPVLEKCTFDEMFAECERRYGSMADYLMTSFYVQPLQGKFESGLMTANMVTVRDLVQNIAGINHEAEKRYCLDRVNEIDSATREERIRIDTERGTLTDVPELEAKKQTSKNTLAELQQNLEPIKSRVALAELAYTGIKSRFDHDKENRDRKTMLGGKIFETQANIENNKSRVEKLLSDSGNIATYQQRLSADEIIKSAYNKAIEERSVVDKRNAEAQTEYQKTKTRMSEIMAEVDRMKSAAREKYNAEHMAWQKTVSDNELKESNRAALEQRITDINKPCPNCGYIDPMTEGLIAQMRKQIAEIIIEPAGNEPVYTDPDLTDLRRQYAELMRIPAPVPEEYVMPSRGMSDAEIQQCKSAIESAQRNATEASTIQSSVIPALEKQIADIQAEYDGIKTEDIDIVTPTAELQHVRAELEAANNEITRMTAEIEQIAHQIADTEEHAKTLDAREAKLAQHLADLSDWKYAADILSASKLPAMELDAVLDTIDAEATRQIVPYRDGRYMYRTLTQQDGISSVIDKFDIIVHDGETGADKSLLKYSVGEKSFLQDAYVKALVKIRTARTKTTYSPIISDEADSFIEIPQIPAYYEMQKNYYGNGSRVLIVSHSPDAGNYIQNKINMEEIVR